MRMPKVSRPTRPRPLSRRRRRRRRRSLDDCRLLTPRLRGKEGGRKQRRRGHCGPHNELWLDRRRGRKKMEWSEVKEVAEKEG